jgi:hypothetical protein
MPNAFNAFFNLSNFKTVINVQTHIISTANECTFQPSKSGSILWDFQTCKYIQWNKSSFCTIYILNVYSFSGIVPAPLPSCLCLQIASVS